MTLFQRSIFTFLHCLFLTLFNGYLFTLFHCLFFDTFQLLFCCRQRQFCGSICQICQLSLMNTLAVWLEILSLKIVFWNTLQLLDYTYPWSVDQSVNATLRFGHKELLLRLKTRQTFYHSGARETLRNMAYPPLPLKSVRSS